MPKFKKLDRNKLKGVRSEKNGYLHIPVSKTIHNAQNPGHKLIGKSFLRTKLSRRLGRTFSRWDNSSAPLFRTDEISIEDIHQRFIGDCWYLSAAASILALPFGSRIMKNAMIDVGDGTVIVRLFEKPDKPVYLRITKSRPRAWWGGIYGVTGIKKTGFWCAALEKAGAYFTGPSRSKLDLQNASMTNLVSGKATEAFRLLLGVDATIVIIPKDIANKRQSEESVLIRHLTNLNWGDRLHRANFNQRDALAVVFRKTLEETAYKRHFATLFPAINHAISGGVGEIRARQTQLIQAGVPQQAVTALIGFFARADFGGLEAGPLGSGVYSSRMKTLYKDIAGYLNAHRAVAFGTVNTFKVTDGKGHSANEPKYRGMVGKHSYAVLGVEEKGGLRYVKVANPWGNTGRSYTPVKDPRKGAPTLTPKETQAGIFLLELADFCSVAEKLYVSQPLSEEHLERWKH